MAKDAEWMRAVLEDIRAFCEEHELFRSEEAIRKAMEIAKLEAAEDDQEIDNPLKH